MFKKCFLVVLLFLIFITPKNSASSIITSQDGFSPVISGLKVIPNSGAAGTDYVISLHITDPQGPDDIVKILYQVREKSEAIGIVINDDGMSGDQSKGDNIYTGKDFVPKTAAKRTHLFEVFAIDKEGHKSNILEYRFTVYERGKII